jgi:two-component system response regulator HydG
MEPVFRVLVVDDEETARWGLARILEREGFQADQAGDGREAARMVAATRYDLIITDLRMPGGGGLEFIQGIQGCYRGAVIFVTAYGSPETYLMALDYDAHEYLNKPVDLDALLAMVREIAARNRPAGD